MLDIVSTHEKYASRFEGIDCVFEIRQTDKTEAPHWEKILMLADHMDDGHDYLMWIDDDAGFIRFDEDFRDRLPTDGKRFYFTQERSDEAGRGFAFLNTGVIMVKCCEENKEVLKFWYSKRHDRPSPHSLWDQPVINDWYFQNTDICGLLDPVVFNAFPKKTWGFPVNTRTKETIVLHLASFFKNSEYRTIFGKKTKSIKATKKPAPKRTEFHEDYWDE